MGRIRGCANVRQTRRQVAEWLQETLGANAGGEEEVEYVFCKTQNATYLP